jgi:hypothetical protein
MSWFLRYMLALLPATVTLGGWLLAIWAYEYFDCQGNLKNLAPCSADTIELLPWLGIGLFWCQLLSYITVPVSAWLLFNVGAKHIGAHIESAT